MPFFPTQIADSDQAAKYPLKVIRRRFQRLAYLVVLDYLNGIINIFLSNDTITVLSCNAQYIQSSPYITVIR